MIDLSKNDVKNIYPKNNLDPAPDKIDTETGKCMWEIKGYRIWAHTYQEALMLLPIIESI